jgi:precorrin-2 C20-methyltransferase / precorrin-3B C17-methyltransferase
VTGRLYGVGLGPGDPELVTVKAQGVLRDADVVAYPCAPGRTSMARAIAAPHLRSGQEELALVYPLTTEQPTGSDRYEDALRAFYDEAADRIADWLEAGATVAVLCEGDPFLSYMYLHERLAHRFPTQVIPGVPSFLAAAAAAGEPLTRRDDVLTILPGTLPAAELTTRLSSTDAAVVLKLGRRFDDVRGAADAAGVLERAIYAERVTWPEQRVGSLANVEGDVPYMALVLVPAVARPSAPVSRRSGSLAVVGLGPAGPDWLTPEARTAIREAEVVVGYGPYVDRLPVTAGQVRRTSDNRVELDRAREALDCALDGAQVAVVSSGDPGIFAMAAAVLEVVDDESDRYGTIDLRIIPGVSAMQVAAARVGAPLGHDFCVVSLSDQLKPWEVIEQRLESAAAADLVLALYNPASPMRRSGIERARVVLSRHRSGETPVVVARALGTAEERVTVTTLDELDVDAVDMRTVLIIGSSMTRVFGEGERPTRVYTPRSYPGVVAGTRRRSR